MIYQIVINYLKRKSLTVSAFQSNIKLNGVPLFTFISWKNPFRFEAHDRPHLNGCTFNSSQARTRFANI